MKSYLNHTIDSSSHAVSELFGGTCEILRKRNISLVNLEDDGLSPDNLSAAQVQLFEFKEAVNSYLKSPGHTQYPLRIEDIAASGLVDLFAVGPSWKTALSPAITTESLEYAARLQRIENLKFSLVTVFAKHQIDAIIYPHQSVLVAPVGSPTQPGRNGLLTSLTGTPGLVVPMGFSDSTPTAKLGVPVGMEVVGLWGQDHKILGIGEMLERMLPPRREPILEEAGQS
jgi:Asp-tRNA(Asn)/Glu-tRNA(Gln) amidotransferase A subunit family amidase